MRLSAALLVAVATVAPAQGTSAPPRAVRRDIPITNAIRRSFGAGTRDSTGKPGRNYWQLKTDYTIRVALDPSTQRLSGNETITLTNNSPDTLRTIGLRLPMNHFLFGVPRAAPWVPAEETDGMVVGRMTVNGQNVNLNPPAPQFGGGRGGQQAPLTEPTLSDAKLTLARINLSSPVMPHATASIQIEWTHKVPGGDAGRNHRMTQRWADTLFQPTQWFPRVAVYDDLRGWDSEFYLGPSEFYNDFGRFDVSITVPAGWIVSGTGELVNADQVLTAKARAALATVTSNAGITTIVGPDEVGPGNATAAGSTLTWHKVAENVNDFAWATAKKYVWTATRASIPGKGYVPVNMYYLPGHANLYADAGPRASHALEFYSKLYFPYSFPQLTLQDGPSAGMEYPMVINSNQGAADHETFHQWAPMTVSNNETWYGWMDEGFNQYANILSGADAANQPANLNGRGQSYGRTSGNEAEPPMMWNANYAGPGFYSFQTYSKTPLMLSMLGGVVGDSAAQRAQREWGTTWRFKHPSPWDYMFFMNNALKKDLGWFWYYWLFTTESVDGSIANVKTAGSKTTVTVKQDGQMPSPVVLMVKLEPGPAVSKVSAGGIRVIDDNTIVQTIPVDVWFDGSRTHDVVFDFGARKVESITLDPCGRFPDRDASDNVWPRVSGPTTSPAGGRGGQQNQVAWPGFCTEK